MGIVYLLLIVSMACRLPFSGETQTSATETPAVDTLQQSSIPIQPGTDLPPQIVEADPLPGSSVGLVDQQFVFIFRGVGTKHILSRYFYFK